MFTFTSRKFYDEFTGSGGAGVTYLNALQGDKITTVIEGYFAWNILDQKFIFDAATQTITIWYSPVSGAAQPKSFIERGFKLGDTIEIVGSPSNNGTYTIAAITDKVITTAQALVSETAPSASIHGTTLITNLDLYYDLIENSSTKSDFVSATDKETVQRYSATGLDAAVATPVGMTIGSKSNAWVTDILTGNVGEGVVEGTGIADYKQSFKITQVFYMTRIWTDELIQNFANRQPPSEFQKNKHLKYICKVDGKFDQYDPEISHTGSLAQQKGATAWFNQSNIQDAPEYSLGSIQYQDDVTLEYLDQLEGSIVNLVTVSIQSRSGKFAAGTTKFILNHFLCPKDPAAYINTATTLLQNIRLDKKIITMDAAAVNGIEFGTDYQSLTDIQAVYVDDYNVLITFKVDYSSATKTVLQSRAADDRLYAFFVSCQDITIATSKNVDRVNVLADFKIMDYDVREADNFGLIDYFHNFIYPNYGVFEINAPKGYQGDPAYVEIPFWIETAVVNGVSPTLQKVALQIVSTKADNDDFIIEEKLFDVSAVRKLADKQTIDVDTTRGFILAEDSPWNRCNVIRDEANDSGTKIAYKLQYGYVLRYEEWIQVVQQNASVDIFKDVEEVVQAWKRYSTGNGWELKLRLAAQVQGYSGVVTKFQADNTFVILEEGDAPQDGVTFLGGLQYFNEEGIQVPTIIKDAPTRIVATFKGDPTVFPTGMTAMNGYMFADDQYGSIFSRRFASTDEDSEEDSPFSSDDLPALNGVVSEVVSNNLRLTEFYNRIQLDTWYTPDENSPEITRLIVARLGYNQANILLQENGSAILQEDGFYILL